MIFETFGGNKYLKGEYDTKIYFIKKLVLKTSWQQNVFS
jgi:hypothetical protein